MPDIPQQHPKHTAFKLLELPVELVLLVLEAMNRPDVLLMAQTCRVMRLIILYQPHDDRVVLYPHIPGTLLPVRMCEEEQLDYLCRSVRDQMDRWVCSDVRRVAGPGVRDRMDCRLCCGIHTVAAPVDHLNIPMVISNSYSHPRTDYRLESCHVQLALKYIRRWDEAGPQQRAYVQKILCPPQDEFPHVKCWDTLDTDTVDKSTIRPKVVAARSRDTDARENLFLLKITRTCTPDRNFELRPFRVCDHRIFANQGPINKTPPELRPDQWRSMFDRYMFGMTAQAFQLRGAEVDGLCAWCRSEFAVSVTADGQAVTFTSWHDLGAEGSLTEMKRTAMVNGGSIAWRWPRVEDWEATGLVRDACSRRALGLTPVSIRRLYEESEAVTPWVSSRPR